MINMMEQMMALMRTEMAAVAQNITRENQRMVQAVVDKAIKQQEAQKTKEAEIQDNLDFPNLNCPEKPRINMENAPPNVRIPAKQPIDDVTIISDRNVYGSSGQQSDRGNHPDCVYICRPLFGV